VRFFQEYRPNDKGNRSHNDWVVKAGIDVAGCRNHVEADQRQKAAEDPGADVIRQG